MPLTEGKKTVAATVSDEMRERIKSVAALKHWSVAATLGLFIDAHWQNWEKELGIVEATTPRPKKKSVQKKV